MGQEGQGVEEIVVQLRKPNRNRVLPMRCSALPRGSDRGQTSGRHGVRKNPVSLRWAIEYLRGYGAVLLLSSSGGEYEELPSHYPTLPLSRECYPGGDWNGNQ